MGLPIFVLAGQSNAAAIRSALERALDQRHGPDGYRLVTVADAGAPLLRGRDGMDWATASELPADLAAQTRAMLDGTPDGDLHGLIWLQGEADTYDFTGADGYKAALDALFTAFRSAVPGASDIPVSLVALSGLAAAAPDRANWNTIRDAQDRLAQDDPRVHLLDPDAVAAAAGIDLAAMFQDHLHYSDAMRAELATAILNLLDSAGQTGNGPVRNGVPTDGDDIFGPDGAVSAMAGGAGSDIYFVDDRGDRITELKDQGNDTVIASVSFSLRPVSRHVEGLTLTGDARLKGIGNGLDNTITGNTGNNRLKGGAGDDVLHGGAGNDVLVGQAGFDRLEGGAGNDRFVVTDRNDMPVEYAGEGRDTVIARVSFALRDHGHEIEVLRLKGTRDLNGMGNGADNLIVGNGGDNRLNGAWGDDRIIGGGGRDRIADDKGDDIFTGGGGADTFVFALAAGNDHITDFRPGTDRLAFEGLTGMADLTFTSPEGSTAIAFGEGSVLTLDGVSAGHLTADDFLFL
ncbi:sialate O-acetylesterase [Chachezhania sediminis]|uniref:sialate O-acetylesterase n=1 Tax=Chachezhania sediminis TaxID=2599291 RepID=UPI00131C17BC|nr:sialate O-acetylesterase [Chachezhania sediminis]